MNRRISRRLLSVLLASWLITGFASPSFKPIGGGEISSSDIDVSPGLPGSFQEVPPEIIDAFSQRRIPSLSEEALLAHSAKLRDKIAGNSADPHLLHELGTVTFHLGGREEAVFLWNAAATKEPNLAPADVMQNVQDMFALLERGDEDGAQALLRALEKRFASQPHFQLLRAEQAMRSNNPGAAEGAFRRAYELAPELYVTSLNLARFYDAVGRPQDAAPLFEEAARLAPGNAEVWAYLGTFLYRRQDAEGALQAMRKARALDSSVPLPERKLAELSMAGADYAKARDWYRRALAVKPSHREAQAIRATLGDVLLRLGLLEEARTEIEAVLAERETPPLLFALATIDEAQGDLRNAEARYRRVLELMPENPLSANNLAMLLIRTGSSYTEALHLAESARRALRGNAIVESTFGCALAHTGDDASAIEVLSRVIAAVPEDAWAHYCLGMSLLSRGRAGDAKDHLGKVQRIDARFPLGPRVEALLKRSRHQSEFGVK